MCARGRPVPDAVDAACRDGRHCAPLGDTARGAAGKGGAGAADTDCCCGAVVKVVFVLFFSPPPSLFPPLFLFSFPPFFFLFFLMKSIMKCDAGCFFFSSRVWLWKEEKDCVGFSFCSEFLVLLQALVCIFSGHIYIGSTSVTREQPLSLTECLIPLRWAFLNMTISSPRSVCFNQLYSMCLGLMTAPQQPADLYIKRKETPRSTLLPRCTAKKEKEKGKKRRGGSEKSEQKESNLKNPALKPPSTCRSEKLQNCANKATIP